MGMKKLFFGLESADQQTLDHMDKGIRVERAIEVLRNCREAGIDYHLFSIIGFPGEPESSARTTLRFFLDHRELFDTPSVSFDIHPFGLELRTEYFADRKQLGLTVLPSALDKDFVIGVGGSDWGNPSGLDAAQVETLLETEFHPALRAAFRSFHATPEPIWPGFEEYAVLYADHYRDRPFPFRTSIPREQGPLAVDWSRALARLADEDEVLLLQRHRGLVVTRATYRQLRARKVERLAALVAMSVDEDGASSMDSERLDWLVAQGYLRLRLLPT
jgi:anaerobic magnesium-protoporphyrin IX monomethyl ester cyclase